MLEKLARLEKEYQDISNQLSQPEISSDPQKLKEFSQRQAALEDTVHLGKDYRGVLENIAEDEKIIASENDSDLIAMAEEELAGLQAQKTELEDKLQVALLPQDPNDSKNVIMEIRAGVGGEEAALFAANLYRMYSRYAEQNRLRLELMSSSRTGIGGFKEVIFAIKGNDAYKRLKYESGVHRVQRVPETEKSGRIHTSAATVAVLPEAEEVDIELDPKDLEVDTFRSSGPGGQSVNTTDSAIRITHKPSGVVVSCQDEKSQHKNRDKAMKVLRSRLLYEEQERQRKERGDARSTQVGSGDRSEKIRTYNYPQDRITDHRIKFSIKNISEVLDGNLAIMIDKLTEEDQQQKLAQS
ncbi:MAG: peptide chain release factor 1 [Parcubacteria group bacterium]